MKKSLFVLMVVIITISMIATLVLAGCDSGAAAETTDEETVEEEAASESEAESGGSAAFGLKNYEPEGGLTFAFTSISTQVAFWVPVKNAIADFSAQYGVKTEHLGPEDYKPEEEVAVLESLLEAGVNGVSIFIPEPGIMDEVIQKYIDNDIPVIIQQTGSDDAVRLGLPYVGLENYTAGLDWGDKIIELLGGADAARGKEILFCTEAPGQSSLEERMRGAKEKLDPAGVIYDTIDVTTDRETAYSNIESAYTSNPNIAGIFSTDTTGTPAAGLFVKNNDLVGEIFVGGFDLTADTLTGIKEGYITFTIDQYPYRVGHLAMTMLYEKVVLGLEPFSHYVPAGFVDQSNVDLAITLSQEGYR